MARTEKITYTFTDDLTGEEVLEEELATISFAYEGRSFTIELAPNNAAEFDELMQKYIDAGTEDSKRANKPSSSSGPKRPGMSKWLKETDESYKGGRATKQQEAAWDALPEKTKAKYQ